MSPGRDSVTRVHLLVCAILAITAGLYAVAQMSSRPDHPDMSQVWYAARAVLHGQNPYDVIGPGRAFQWPAPLFYPLPAALVALPIAPFPEPVAVFLFAATGAFLFAWALSTDDLGGLWAFASVCVQDAFSLVQWAPWWGAAAVFPVLSVVLIAKPTIGAAVFAYRPNRWAVGGAIVLTVVAFLIQPGWLADWRHALQALSVGRGSQFAYLAPITQPGGFLVLLALSRWRRPEARLLVVLACVPQTMLFYEGTLLFLIPKGWRQMVTLAALSWALRVYVGVFIHPIGLTAALFACAKTMTWFLYLPCTLMVLRRPNEGAVPVALPVLRRLLHRRAA